MSADLIPTRRGYSSSKDTYFIRKELDIRMSFIRTSPDLRSNVWEWFLGVLAESEVLGKKDSACCVVGVDVWSAKETGLGISHSNEQPMPTCEALISILAAYVCRIQYSEACERDKRRYIRAILHRLCVAASFQHIRDDYRG
jgi:hypothetical protein